MKEMSIKEQFIFYRKRFRYGDLSICEIILNQYSDEELNDKDKLKEIYNELIENCIEYNAITIIKNKITQFC